jgi:hypothetical protein
MAIAGSWTAHRELEWDDSEHESELFMGRPTLVELSRFISDYAEFSLSQSDYDRLIAGETLDHFVSQPLSKPNGLRYRVWIDGE